jgi:ABC-type transport system involved in multi-copper enzyme maturation permease subunit
MVANIVVATLAPFIEKSVATTAILTMDPTTNILFAGRGPLLSFVIIIAAMALLSGERDRGTLAWNLTNPVSRPSILLAKWLAAMIVFTVVGVLVPRLVAIPVATIAYGELPILGTLAIHGALSLLEVAFFAALTVALGTVIRSTAGVAGIALIVVFASSALAGIVPLLGEILPPSIGVWALQVAGGPPASMLTLAGWAIAMVALAILAKMGFDRQEL